MTTTHLLDHYPSRRRSLSAGWGPSLFLLFVVAMVVFVALAGPAALAYDLNHLCHPEKSVSMFSFPIVVAGILFSEVVIPAAVVVWALVCTGVLH